jgi:hypothetical protein
VHFYWQRINQWNLSKVAVIDTEAGSSNLYAHLGSYNVLNLESPHFPEIHGGNRLMHKVRDGSDNFR